MKLNPMQQAVAKYDCLEYFSVNYGSTNLFRAMIASVFQEKL